MPPISSQAQPPSLPRSPLTCPICAAPAKASGHGEGACRKPGAGPDLDQALAVLKELKRETLALAWRKRSESLGLEGRRASQPDDAAVAKPLAR